MQNLEWTKEDINNKLSKGVWNEKQKVFCELGLLIYEKYKQALEGQIDFNILIAKILFRYIHLSIVERLCCCDV